MARINLGNNSTKGYVNFVSPDNKRIVIGTGSYKNAQDETVFKGSVTVFFDAKFDGEIPAKGDFVQVSGDLSVQPRKNDAEQLDATYNIRFKNQLTKTEAPAKRDTTAPAGAEGDDI
jgi:hypothetical protein